MFEQIIEMENALPFLCAQIAAGEQAAQSSPAGTVARIGENVRRAVRKRQPRAGVIGERQFLLAFDEMGAYDAGDGIAITQPHAGKPDMRSLQHQLLGMRSPAQEREIRGDGEFEIARHHAYIPCRNQRGSDSATSR